MGSTVIVTDAKYRASLALMRSLTAAGYKVILTQTAAEADGAIPAFESKYAAEKRLFDCSLESEAYTERLLALCAEYDRPVLFPVGAKTLLTVSRNLDRFVRVCDLTVAAPEKLELANDKREVAKYAEKLGIPIPHQYENGELPSVYPVIIKPVCGEKFGLGAAKRYAVAENEAEYRRAYERMSVYGKPIVQEKLTGEAVGVSLLMSAHGAVSAICHKRIREYPASGGPSACCESFFDETLVKNSERLLESLGFVGIAMVEYKAGRLLEINPRVWGSFPLTYVADATFADDYVRLSRGEAITHALDNYKCRVRMNFVLSDLAAIFDYARHGRFADAFGGVGDLVFRRAFEGMHDKYGNDSAPYRTYLKKKLFGKRK